MSINSDRDRLLQKRNLDWIRRVLKATEMVTVYRPNPGVVRDDYFILCALISTDKVEQVLSDTKIDNMEVESSCGLPEAFDLGTEDGKTQVQYLRYGNENGFEPLVIRRSFGGIKEAYNEISEEFRHFHGLYHDRKTDTYIKIDDAGNEETVAIVKPDEVQIRLKEIRQFLAVKEMCLSMLFEFNEYSEYSLQELGLSEVKPREFKRDDLMYWGYDRLNTPNRKFRSDSRLRGRRLIKPLPKSKSGFGSFATEPARSVKFIVDVDENGDEVHHTCDPSKLRDVSGGNPDAVSKYTVVHFRKQVLGKYYNEPGKYTVTDSMVSCGLWSMKIDNHHSSGKICVFLGELGRLPYTEQCHWSQPQYNIPPEGGVSETFYRRMVLGEWANSDQPDHLFKQSYEQLQKACDECLDWQLLKPLSSGDKYRFQHLRVPTVDEESHFKGLVSDLSNLLIERLNEKYLKGLIPANKRKEIKRGINLLEYILDSRKVEGAEKHIIFLRCLWDLRTTRSSAHPEILNKKEYKRAAAHFDLENLDRREAFANILKEAVEFLNFLIPVVRDGKLSDENGGNC